MLKKSLALALLALVSISCTKKDSAEKTEAATTVATADRTLNLAIWSHYITPETLKAFEQKTGIKIQQSNYSSNEELLAKLQAGASGYDVAVPSDYMVFAMIKLGLLAPLDFSKLPNSKSLDTRFMKKVFDPENKHSVPYSWGTTGIAVNRSLFKGQIKGWKDLFTNPELNGKYTLLDDVREVMGAALKMHGYSLNSTKPEELAKAKETLAKARANVKAFTSETMSPLATGETAVSHAFLGDALKASKEGGGKIEYVLPEEGGTLWIDNLVIPMGAPHLAEAHEFIDFMMEPANMAETVKGIFAAPANKDAFELLPADLKANKSLFPSDAELSKFEMIHDLGDDLAKFDRIWTELKIQ